MKMFTLYSRRGCHLCDEMRHALEEVRNAAKFSLQVVDIDKENELVRRYGDRVPVLADSSGREICAVRFDEAAFMRGME